MPASTPLGITYPTNSDQHPSAAWWQTLATTTDYAVSVANAATRAWAAELDMESNASTREYVDLALAGAGLEGSSSEQIDAAVERVLSSQAWANRKENGVNVKAYGAKGDGVKDDTAAIQAALNNTDGLPVHFAPGLTYRVTAPLVVPSGVWVHGHGAVIVGSGSLSSLFSLTGTESTVEVPLVGTYGAGDSLLTTETDHGLSVGETFRVVGQRQAASIDAPPADRLGMATSNARGPWVGEYLTVREVTSARQVLASTGLIFNGYRADASAETHPEARARTTLNRITWHTGTLIEDLTIRASTSNTVRMTYCRDAVIRNVRDERTSTAGAAVSMLGCYRCTITGCHAQYLRTKPADVLYYQRNLFKLVSSQACVVDQCTADGGGQVVDVTYLQANKIPSIACVIRRCLFTGFDDNPVTTHPGTWGTIIVDNEFRAGNDAVSANGIGIRSPYSLVTGNTVAGIPSRGTSDPFVSSGSYGVHLYDGGGHHCQITGNQITGFDIGVGISDGGEPAERHGELHDLIASNNITDTYFGVLVRKSSYSDPSIFSALAVTGNQIASRLDGACGVQLDNGSASTRAPAVTSNTFHFTGSSPVPIRVGKNTKDPVLTANTVTGTAATLYQTQPDASNGTIALAANTVVTPSGVVQVPPTGTGGGGTVSLRPDPTVDGAYLIGD
ncbi:glycosyl hydrolase family 28-related protein [Kocuria salsicia]|uniref:glycosyl hydrolase family 28-related protein n=1 Tax=Kocuria salsicia TaxID=664639 RepID=UPI0011A9E970|nr:glycosyl hydrolase family 28-related protein [Kocuria salsicia]